MLASPFYMWDFKICASHARHPSNIWLTPRSAIKNIISPSQLIGRDDIKETRSHHGFHFTARNVIRLDHVFRLADILAPAFRCVATSVTISYSRCFFSSSTHPYKTAALVKPPGLKIGVPALLSLDPQYFLKLRFLVHEVPL